MKHTPGPWEVVRHAHIDDELWLSVNQHADAHGMKEWIAEIKYLTTDPERQWANAHLIAAAPELLEAARLLEAFLRAVDWTDSTSEQNAADIRVTIEAAIAKAEGCQAR